MFSKARINFDGPHLLFDAHLHALVGNIVNLLRLDGSPRWNCYRLETRLRPCDSCPNIKRILKFRLVIGSDSLSVRSRPAQIDLGIISSGPLNLAGFTV